MSQRRHRRIEGGVPPEFDARAHCHRSYSDRTNSPQLFKLMSAIFDGVDIDYLGELVFHEAQQTEFRAEEVQGK